MSTVKRLQNTYYIANDVERLSAFYRDGLGLAVKFNDGARWSQLAVGDANFALASHEEAAGDAAGAIAVFEVEGDSLREQIVASGGTFLDARDMGSHGIVETYKDPEGNIFQTFSRMRE